MSLQSPDTEELLQRAMAGDRFAEADLLGGTRPSATNGVHPDRRPHCGAGRSLGRVQEVLTRLRRPGGIRETPPIALLPLAAPLGVGAADPGASSAHRGAIPERNARGANAFGRVGAAIGRSCGRQHRRVRASEWSGRKRTSSCVRPWRSFPAATARSSSCGSWNNYPRAKSQPSWE